MLFDAADTNRSGVDTAHQVSYAFSFGDDRGQTWAHSGQPKNVQSGGPLAAHVFDLPGSYVVRVRATGTDGATSERTVTVTVQSPDSAYAGTQTMCVSASSNYSGCPSGAALQTTLPTSYAGKRVLLRRGESFGSISPRNTDANFQVGAFGAGAKPIVSGVYTGMVSGVASWANDFTIMDLNIGSGGVGIDATGSRILVYRCDINSPSRSTSQVNIGTAVGYYQSNNTGTVPNTIYWPREIFIVENDIQGVVNSVSQPNIALMGFFTQSAVMGNTIDKATEHSMRVWASHKFLISHNLIGGNHYSSGGPGIRQALKMHSSGTDAYTPTVAGSTNLATRYVVVSNNTIGSPTFQGNWLMGLGPQNVDPGTQEKMEDLIIENNRIVRGPYTSQDLHVLAGRVTTRGNTVSTGGTFNGDAVTVQERASNNLLNDSWMGPYFGQIR